MGKIWAEKLMAKESAQHARDLESLRGDLMRETESHKIRLRKSELIFQREVEAASELVALSRHLSPQRWRPGMDWDDVCDDIASDFHLIEKELRAFLAKHGAVLPGGVKDDLGWCIAIAGEGKFEVGETGVPGGANTEADQLIKKLWDVENDLISHVRSQTSV